MSKEQFDELTVEIENITRCLDAIDARLQGTRILVGISLGLAGVSIFSTIVLG